MTIFFRHSDIDVDASCTGYTVTFLLRRWTNGWFGARNYENIIVRMDKRQAAEFAAMMQRVSDEAKE